jgi:hypothetical protein
MSSVRISKLQCKAKNPPRLLSNQSKSSTTSEERDPTSTLQQLLRHAHKPLCASRVPIKPKQRQAAGPRACPGSPKPYVSAAPSACRRTLVQGRPADMRAAPMFARKPRNNFDTPGCTLFGRSAATPTSTDWSRVGPGKQMRLSDPLWRAARPSPRAQRVRRLADVRAWAAAARVLCSAEFSGRLGWELGIHLPRQRSRRLAGMQCRGVPGGLAGRARWPRGCDKHNSSAEAAEPAAKATRPPPCPGRGMP